MTRQRRNTLERIQLALALLSISMFVMPAQAIEVAGTLFVDLKASDPSAGTATWANAGTLGDFSIIGDPQKVNVTGTVPAILFDGNDDAYVGADLAPTGIVGPDPTRTIEAWVLNPSIASEETVVSWGKRGGPDGSNMSFNYGNHGSFGAVGHWGGADIGWVDNNGTAGAPAAGQWHHLVYTYDGATTRVYSDGVLQNSEMLGAGAINTHADSRIAIASQWESDGTTLTGPLKGSMAIGQVRIHDGVLSDSQILSNYDEEKGAYPQPPGPVDPTPKMLTMNPIHRYSFNNDPNTDDNTLYDTYGNANGVVKGAGSEFTGTGLKLPGGSSAEAAYGDLPNGLISGLTDATIEGWVSIDGVQNWARIFDFGSSEQGEVDGPGNPNPDAGTAGLDYLMLSASRGEDQNAQRVELRNEDPAGGGITTIDANPPTDIPQEIHFAVVLDSDGGFFGEPVVKYYRDGELLTEGTTNIPLSEINDVNNWLGRSNWTNDANFQGTFDEFRIYEHALTHDEIVGNIEAGPEVVNIPEPTSIVILLGSLAGLAFGLTRRRRATR